MAEDCMHIDFLPDTDPAIPHRRLRLGLDLGADDLDELCGALRRIANDLEIEAEEEHDQTSGGYADGYRLVLRCNPDQTGDKFRGELEAWRQARVAERKAATNG